ncbi:MAG: hypothetical protein EHM93_03725 [Bacteroidales bacterium]|nr:MAG: hypothetical protein EHM93_03725 [Bacteroidales bacterium]
METRIENILTVTKKLILLSATTLLSIALIFGATLFWGNKLMISWICIMCGILGGFVSIQQRIKKISSKELQLLSKSWFQILLIPIYGGIFSLILYVIFLSNMLSGQFFPSFNFPSIPESGVDTVYLQNFLINTYPQSGQDLAKLIFWCFLAGFSERFVPQVISNISNETEQPK